MTVNPFNISFGEPVEPVELDAPAEAPVYPQRFADVSVGARFTPGKFGSHIDIAFGNLNLDDGVDFFAYLASDEGQDELTTLLLAQFVEQGVITLTDALSILLSD